MGIKNYYVLLSSVLQFTPGGAQPTPRYQPRDETFYFETDLWVLIAMV